MFALLYRSTPTLLQGRRGSAGTSMVAGVALFGALGAISIDLGHAVSTAHQMQSVADVTAMAGAMELDGTPEGIEAARQVISEYAELNDLGIDMSDVDFGVWDAADRSYRMSANAEEVDTARVRISRQDVGFGFSDLAFDIAGYDLTRTALALHVDNFGDPDDKDGVPGGHFDVDTTSYIAEAGKGKTDGHTHEYDNRYDVTFVDAFNLLDSKLHNISEDVADNEGDMFRLIVANADLSPGMLLEINGHEYDIEEYAEIPYLALPSYSLGSLESLRLSADLDTILRGELIRTQTGCVRKNTLGADGEWRNGALTLQAVALGARLDHSIPATGGQGVAADNLLWEMTVFWHDGDACYHEADWEEETEALGTTGSEIVRPLTVIAR